MEYSEAIKYLTEQLPMFQRIGTAAYKNNLDNTIALDNFYENPHRNFKTIHIGGTNGKGSVSHMIASILQCSGYNVGLFTSPHLKDFRERIRVNGKKISKIAVTNFVRDFISNNENIKPSFFELSVSLAFKYFKDLKVDVAVIEVGLGGRLDCTNIISPELSVITNISFDHTNILGDTLEKIALEKAGIIKNKIPIVIGESQKATDHIFIKTAEENNAEIVFSDKVFEIIPADVGVYNVISEEKSDLYNIGLNGIYQQKNLSTVFAAINVLRSKGFLIDNSALKKGLSDVVINTGLMGRWQLLSDNPRIICDTGHNEGGIKYIIRQLESEKFDKLHIVFGMVNDKDITKILELLPASAIYYFTKAKVERALDENNLKQKAADHGLMGNSYPTVKSALKAAKENSSKNDLIFIGGSTFVVAEVI